MRHHLGLPGRDVSGSHLLKDALQRSAHGPGIVQGADCDQGRRLGWRSAVFPLLLAGVVQAQHGVLRGAEHPASAAIAKSERAAGVFQSLNLPAVAQAFSLCARMLPTGAFLTLVCSVRDVPGLYRSIYLPPTHLIINALKRSRMKSNKPASADSKGDLSKKAQVLKRKGIGLLGGGRRKEDCPLLFNTAYIRRHIS